MGIRLRVLPVLLLGLWELTCRTGRDNHRYYVDNSCYDCHHLSLVSCVPISKQPEAKGKGWEWAATDNTSCSATDIQVVQHCLFILTPFPPLWAVLPPSCALGAHAVLSPSFPSQDKLVQLLEECILVTQRHTHWYTHMGMKDINLFHGLVYKSSSTFS